MKQLYKRILFDKRKGANVHKSFVIDLKDNEDITELLTYIEGMLKNHYVSIKLRLYFRNHHYNRS